MPECVIYLQSKMPKRKIAPDEDCPVKRKSQVTDDINSSQESISGFDNTFKVLILCSVHLNCECDPFF